MTTSAATAQAPTERRARILEAACRVIVRDGAHGLRMASVATEADVSKALVHYYFATRQELLRHAFAFSEQRWQAALDAELEHVGTGAARVERMLLATIETGPPFSEQRALGNEVWSSLRTDEELRPVVERSYRAWLARIVDSIEAGTADGSDPRRRRRDGGGLAARGGGRRARLAALPGARRSRRSRAADAGCGRARAGHALTPEAQGVSTRTASGGR